jgi:Fur family transcriptional regulator, peroxide stress response regulator
MDEDLDERCRSFMSRCRARGLRITTQRMAVFRALAGEASHPTADAVYAALRKTMPVLSLSTVYRILESLEREGLIRRINSGNGAARFDANLNPHQHLVCRLCDRMTDLEEASFAGLRLLQPQFSGFTAEEIDIRIIGVCPECRRAEHKFKRSTGKSPNGNCRP